MEYLPGSYESKLSSLFNKPSNGTSYSSNKQPEYPIYIPPSLSSGDENALEHYTTTQPPRQIFPQYPFLSPTRRPTFWDDKTQSEKIIQDDFSPPNFGNNIVLDLDGNIAADGTNFDVTTTRPPPDIEKLVNKTIWNVSSIVNDFLTTTTTTTTTPSIQPANETTTSSSDLDLIVPPNEAPNDDLNKTTATTLRPHIFQDLSPVASTELLITYGFFVIFLAILGIITNSATVHVLFKDSINLHIRKHYTNMTILSLAVVNLIGSIFVGFGGGLNVICLGFGSISEGSNVVEMMVVPESPPIVTTPMTIRPTNFDMMNSSAIATIISAYANVTFADLASLNEAKIGNDTFNGAQTVNETQIFPSIKRKVKFHVSRKRWDHNSRGGLCQFQCFFNNVANFVTIWTLAVISMDRFFAHTWPVKYSEFMSRTKFAIIMVFIWLQGIFVSSLSIELWTRDKLLDKGVSSGLCHCAVNWLYIPRTAPLGVAFLKLIAFMWMSLLPYAAILILNSIIMIRFVLGSGDTKSNPHQDQMIWRVMPPPLSPNSLQPNNPAPFGNPPIKELFSSTFAGTQMRRSRLWELHRLSQTHGGKIPSSSREATTKSVLTCYLVVIFSYIWLQTWPTGLSFLLFVADGHEDSFILMEMVAFLFKLIGFSVNAGIYFWLRKDFHDAFSLLFRQTCACEMERRGGGRNVRTGPQGGGGDVPGVVVEED
ncbi:D(5)-like dopamine receptor, partial [Folsomia candida]